MSTFEKTFNVLQDTGLNWSVEKKPLVSEDGLPTESYGIFRNDNNAWLGTAGERLHTLSELSTRRAYGRAY